MILIKVENNLERFIKKCIANKINLYNIKKEESYLLVVVAEADLKEIKKLNYYSKITLEQYLGKKNILLKLKKNIFNLVMLGLFLFLLFFYSHVIVTVEVKHENKEMIKKIEELLAEKDIKKYTLKKDNNTLNNISDEILAANRDFLDFISITNVGMKYIVNLEERIMTPEEEKKERCHVVAKKSGVITNITTKKGVTMVEKGALVAAGDILISGEIILNEEIKDNVCSSGEVIANTWYKINIKYPLVETKTTYTKREKVNIKMYNNYFKKKLYDSYTEEKIFKVGGLSLVRQKETRMEEINLTEEEAKNKAIDEAISKLLEKIDSKSQVIDKKVLNSSTNNSTIELEIFVSVLEPIGETVEYEGRDKIDTNEGV